MKSEIEFRIYAENHLRARLLEAENYRMLNELREHYPNGISRGWHEFVGRLIFSKDTIGEKLEDFEASLAMWFEFEG